MPQWVQKADAVPAVPTDAPTVKQASVLRCRVLQPQEHHQPRNVNARVLLKVTQLNECSSVTILPLVSARVSRVL